MAFKLKLNLLIDILSYDNASAFKYSKCLLNIKTLWEIEKSEGFNFTPFFVQIYNEIVEKEHEFMNKIPLLIVEKYYYSKITNLNGYVSINYFVKNDDGDDEDRILNIPVNDLYLELEAYFNKIFLLASLFANYYNLEIKINDTATKNKTFI
jgi:hypothetical protein